jgi:DUF1680 family protein
MANLFSKKICLSVSFLICCLIGCQHSNETVRLPEISQDYPITSVSFTQVHLTDQFWKPRIERMFTVTIPHELDELRSTGRDSNFVMAAKNLKTHANTGSFCTKYPFDDTDLYKVIQGISYLLQIRPDAELKARMDSLINLIADAQAPDGYLYTARTIDPSDPPDWSGKHRWENVENLSHELYCSGHLFQAASANYVATGDKKLLNVAIKNADLLDQTFGWGKLEKYPGHPEVELGLVSLYRVTGNKKYLELAKFFLDVRGPGGDPYRQAQKKVVNQRKAVGHAVRAGYLYSAMADVSALTGNGAYLNADNYIWEDIVTSQIYITGGIGATNNGEAFGDPYQLPNMTAYNETCASIANVYFNKRMFLSHGGSKYYDVLERTLYNALLSGLSLKEDKFFYPNPLESKGQYTRSSWFGCSCCPTNLARFIPTVGGYFYATQGNNIYINLYGANKATISLKNQTVNLTQWTDYPRSGNIKINIDPERSVNFTLKLRIPGWVINQPIPSDLYNFKNLDQGTSKTSTGYLIQLNGEIIHPEVKKGYAIINKTWNKGDQINLKFPMKVHVITANHKVKADRGKVSLQRGPLMYCLEGPDNLNDQVLNLVMDSDQTFTTSFKPYTWANRGGHEMTVWIPTTTTAALKNTDPNEL